MIVAKETSHAAARRLVARLAAAQVLAAIRFRSGGWVVTVETAEDAERAQPIVAADRAARRRS